jgi:hypothetical protein
VEKLFLLGRQSINSRQQKNVSNFSATIPHKVLFSFLN